MTHTKSFHTRLGKIYYVLGRTIQDKVTEMRVFIVQKT